MKDRPTSVHVTASAEKYKNITHILLFSLIACIALFVDQLTKLIAFYYLPNVSSYFPIIPGWLGFSHYENDSIAYGLGNGNPVFMTIVKVLTAVLMVVIPVLSFKAFKDNHPAQICLALIESGAAGNFIDRLFVRGIKNGEVVAVVRDFVDLSKFGFGNCNIADFCITFGAVALIFILLFIGPQAAFPLKKAWREEAERAEKEERK